MEEGQDAEGGAAGHTDPPSWLAVTSSFGLMFKMGDVCSQVAQVLWLTHNSALVPPCICSL